MRDPYDGLRPWSAITHGIGAALAVVGTVFLAVQSAWMGKWENLVLFLIYGVSMVCLYTASTLYHCVNTTRSKRIALRKYDHCSIYLLIAGSYTPRMPHGAAGRWRAAPSYCDLGPGCGRRGAYHRQAGYPSVAHPASSTW